MLAFSCSLELHTGQEQQTPRVQCQSAVAAGRQDSAPVTVVVPMFTGAPCGTGVANP